MEKIPWYQSAIVRQQIVAFILAAFGLFKFSTDLDIDATVGAILAGVAAIVPIWTILTRIFKPAPNMSTTAANKEVELKAEGKFVEPRATTKQGGFALPSMLAIVATLAIVGGAVMTVTACTGTQSAYRTASHSDAALADTAYVVAEHYAALVHEAADLAALPTTDRAAVDAMKAADAAVKPWILGNPDTGQPGVRDLAQRYQSVKSAQTAEELQTAINGAVLELAKLINAVKAARR